MSVLKNIRDFTVTGKEKAAIAFIVATAGSYIIDNGLTLDQILTFDGMKALALGIIAHLCVYWTTNASPN